MAERRFDHRVAVITGAGRGLGREYALLLASKGAKVIVNDNGSSMQGTGTEAGPAEDVVAEIRKAGGQAFACTESVATREGCTAIVQCALDQFGQIDILVHNAGNVRYVSLLEIEDEDFKSVIDVHLMGAYYLVRRCFPLMCKAGYGRIVLTSSIGGIYGWENVVGYGVAKTGIIGLNNVVAIEGADKNVKCNIITPGAVTRMAEGLDISQYPPMGPDLVAPAVAWLAHESCSVTGEMLIAIAGRVARAMIAETPGIYRPSWTVDEIAENIDAIRDPSRPWILSPLSGHREHIARSFALARKDS